MMVIYTLVAISLEFFVGVFFGILLQNSSHQSSLDELKIASSLFIIVLATWYISSPGAVLQIVFDMSYLWIALISGVLLGELIKKRFLGRIVFILKKKDVQVVISEFEVLASYVTISDNCKYNELMYKKLNKLTSLIESLKKYKTGNRKHWDKHLDEITSLCHEYANLSRAIGNKHIDLKTKKEELVKQMQETGKDLANIVYHTLNHSQEDLNSIGVLFKKGGFNANSKRNESDNS